MLYYSVLDYRTTILLYYTGRLYYTTLVVDYPTSTYLEYYTTESPYRGGDPLVLAQR